MEIKIFSRLTLESFLPKNSKQHSVIYYTNSEYPEYPFVKQHAIDSLHSPVDDIDHYELKHYVAPTATEVQKFLDFADGRKNLICVCSAGICRSSATAYLIASKASGPINGLKILTPAHHFPNRLIVYIGSKILEQQSIWEKYVQWMRAWNRNDPSQGGDWPNQQIISKMGFDKLKDSSIIVPAGLISSRDFFGSNE